MVRRLKVNRRALPQDDLLEKLSVATPSLDGEADMHSVYTHSTLPNSVYIK